MCGWRRYSKAIKYLHRRYETSGVSVSCYVCRHNIFSQPIDGVLDFLAFVQMDVSTHNEMEFEMHSAIVHIDGFGGKDHLLIDHLHDVAKETTRTWPKTISNRRSTLLGFGRMGGLGHMTWANIATNSTALKKAAIHKKH